MSKFSQLCDEFEQVLAMDSEFRQRWLRLREEGERLQEKCIGYEHEIVNTLTDKNLITKKYLNLDKIAEWQTKSEKWEVFEDYLITSLVTSNGTIGFGEPLAVKEFVENKQKLEKIREMVDGLLDNDSVFVCNIKEVLGE